MRRFGPLLLSPCLSLCLGACPQGEQVDPDTSTTSTVGTSSVSTTPTTTTSAPTSTSSDTGASTGSTTGDACDGGSFIASCELSCAVGEICVFEQLDGAAETACRPNPDGCVPSDPCSPACAALCDQNTVCGATCGGLACNEPITCGLGLEDCADGKCAPADVLEQGDWNGTRCVPIGPDPAQLGEPCTAEGKSGVDSCDEDLMCVGGVCVPLCNEPVLSCPAGFHCTTYIPFILILCTPSCDPMQQDCPAGESCLPVADPSPGFVCLADDSGAQGQAGDTCAALNGCDPGLICVFAPEVPDCAGDLCCTPFCDLNQPNDCPQAPEQSCLPAFADQQVEGFEQVGYCGVAR